MVDPTESMQKDYEFLLEVEEEILKKMQHGECCRYLSDWKPGVGSSILARSHTFVEIDHEIISTITLAPSADSRRVVVSYKLKYVHKLLVNRLFKPAQEKVWLG